MEPIRPAIPQTNPGVQIEELRREIEEAMQRVLSSGRYILGEEVEAFEEEWAQWCNVSHAVGCASGTDGLELILRALDLPRGSKVLAPSHTAIATIAAIERAGMSPFLADVSLKDYTLDIESVQRCLERAKEDGEPIKALIAVHLYGQPCNIGAIQELCEEYDIPLIEDGSQAHGARWKGKKVGSFGIAAAFSLYPTKNLGALGDAGVVTTQDHRIAEKIKQIRQYGWKEQAISEVKGINSRLDPLQAAILRVKLQHLNTYNRHRQEVAREYNNHMIKTIGVQLPPQKDELIEPVYHQFVIQVPKERRDNIRIELSKLGVGTLLHYPKAAHQMPAYQNQGRAKMDPNGLKKTEELIQNIISMPMGTHISIEQAKEISTMINHLLK